MSVYDEIIAHYPELATDGETFRTGIINLQDDGNGAFIRAWNYSKPLPPGLKIAPPPAPPVRPPEEELI
jgi:hypothetical protein